MNQQDKPPAVLEALAEAMGCLCFIILFFGFLGLGIYSQVKTLEREATDLKQQLETNFVIEGEVAKIENSTGPDKIIEKKGNITITLTVPSDRTKIYFKDGRSKEFLGMLKKPIELGKYYKITYNKYDILIEIAEE